MAMPDGDMVVNNSGDVRRYDRDPTKRIDTLPPRKLTHKKVLAYTAWPYAFALMDLDKGDSLVMPGYEHMTDTEYYARIEVGGLRIIKDMHGREYEVRKVTTHHRATLEEAQANGSRFSPGQLH